MDAADHDRPLPHFALPSKLRAHVSITTEKVQSRNVVGLRPGVDPQLKNEYVILSAHLDHLGVGEPVNGDAIFNGAMDDASGIASLIEIARALQAGNVNTKRSILFLAVTGEEKGELGFPLFRRTFNRAPAASWRTSTWTCFCRCFRSVIWRCRA